MRVKSNVELFYKSILDKNAFIPVDNQEEYPQIGTCWQLKETVGHGYYWIYDSQKGYNIKIHDFSLKKDTLVNMSIPECLSVSWYTSIAGEELDPYHQLKSNVVKSYLGGYKPFKAIIHKEIPVRSIGIEYEPCFYESFLNSNYREEYQYPAEVFKCVNEATDFKKMEKLLLQIAEYKSTGLTAQLFFDAKASEALSYIYERHDQLNRAPHLKISHDDQENLTIVSTFIEHHCSENLTIEMLSKIACMGTTKFKKYFKDYFNCTVAEYITQQRIGQAEHLLINTDLSIGQVAKAVGYLNPGYFSEVFRKEKGILPLEFRKLT